MEPLAVSSYSHSMEAGIEKPALFAYCSMKFIPRVLSGILPPAERTAERTPEIRNAPAARSVAVPQENAYAGARTEHRRFLLSRGMAASETPEDPVLRVLRQHRIDAVKALLAGAKRNRFDITVEEDFACLIQDLEPANKKNSRKFQKDLIKLLARHVLPEDITEKQAKNRATSLYKQALVDFYNAQKWESIERTFYHDGELYISRLTPAGQIKHNGHNIFAKDYKDQGVSSGTSTCTDHAANLWISEFTTPAHGRALIKEEEKVLFRGVRHGILSPYGMKPGELRDEGALNRAKEVAAAALFLRQDKFQAALNGEEVELKLTSTSLVTAFNFGHQTEGKQLADQLNAWKKLCDENPATLQIRDADGNLKNIKVRLQVAAFNFGVNEAALNLKLGWSDSDRQNKIGLQQLLGDDLNPGGIEGGWVLAYLKQRPSPKNAEIVAQLSKEIREIWDRKLHHKDGGEPYKLAQRIALLSHYMGDDLGIVPCYNCKSGKDRTGMLDSEIKREAVQLHRHGVTSKRGRKLDVAQQEVFRKVLESSGNMEIQEKNTGAPGNKVLKKLSLWGNNLSFRTRIGSMDSFKKAKGASGQVST